MMLLEMSSSSLVEIAGATFLMPLRGCQAVRVGGKKSLAQPFPSGLGLRWWLVDGPAKRRLIGVRPSM
jgi:hypothetical protein